MSQAIDFTVVVFILKKSPLLEDMMPINIVQTGRNHQLHVVFICSFRIYEHGYTKLLHYGFVFLGIVGQQSYIGQNDGTFVPGVNYSILRSKYFCCRHRQIKELSCLFELYRDAIVPTWATIS